MAPHFGNNGQLSREERVQLYGIDCEDQVVWNEKWQPGHETVMDLVLQNVALVTQKVKFKLPGTKEFDMPYPEPFKLAPGMKKSIPISFRPSKYVPHVDQVQIVTKGGSFFVTVKAMVKDIAISVRNFLDFGLCPTNEKSEMQIDVHNCGTLKARLKWHEKPPFKIRAPSDVIEVGTVMRCKVEFEPDTAQVFDAMVYLEPLPADILAAASEDALLDGDATKLPSPANRHPIPIRATGVGKMPHLAVVGKPRAVVEFGKVYPGNKVPQTLEITNTTPVRATFKVQPQRENSRGAEVMPLPPSPFSVYPETGVVEPWCSYTLTFYFQSHTVKEFACQRFQITTPGGTALAVTCTALCRPMQVQLSTRSINFGEVPCGKTCTRTLMLHNESDRPACYHFINMDHLKGIFWTDKLQGVIPAESSMAVSVFFGPNVPNNYYKHATVVVKGALKPMSIHLLGTSYSEESRPAFLEMCHVDCFRNMQMQNVREHEPPRNDESQGDNDRYDDEDEEEAEEKPTDKEMEVSATQSFLELMLPMDSKLRDITVTPADLDFGSCSTVGSSEKHSVTITNRTSQKVSVMWIVGGETRMLCSPDEKSLFSVYPLKCDIKPRGSHDFTVSFRPQIEGTFEAGLLEAVVYQKVNRTFRLVDLRRFTPPWKISVRGMGHTMGSTRNDPHLEITPNHDGLPFIRCRACSPGQLTYQVAMLTNPGDTWISYQFLPPVDASGEESREAHSLSKLADAVPFRVYPKQGVIEPHHFHLVVVEFAPTTTRNEIPFAAKFPVVVDYNASQPLIMRVSGRSWEPKLSVCRGQQIVTFPPTCSGIVSNYTCDIQNVSEIPISYECQIPHRKRTQFWFPNPNGKLGPSASIDLVAQFCPNREDTCSTPLYCVARARQDLDDVVKGPLEALVPAQLSTQEPQRAYVLQFVGHGKGPALLVDPESLDLGAIRACDEVKKELKIVNCSQLAVHYTVEVIFEGADQHAKRVAREALQLEREEGTIAGRCTEVLRVTFAPPCRGIFEYCLKVTPKGGSQTNQGACFKLRADAQYPFIQIADLRTECATLQPQSMMWTQFQVDGINELYKGEVADEERAFQNAIGIDEKKRLVKLLRPFQLLFGTAAAGTSPTIVYLSLSNPSRLKIRFSFHTPKNLGLENVPYWCDEKALVDSREAHFNWVEEHGIYDISPRSGEILPGDFLHVKMTYHHHSVGTHILPVVFNVHDGRSCQFYLKAHSVAPQVGCLSVRASVVQLQPVPLDVERGPVQPVELTNSGGVAAPWRVDLNSIREHNENNYDFDMLSVSPLEGVLEPQSSTFLHFIFTPLEAKSYAFPVRIEMMKDGRPAEELVFELRTNGYDPKDDPPDVPPTFPPSLPIQTYAPVPGCGAALSIEILDFGKCPLRSCVSRMLVLVNYTSEFVLSFRWESRQLFRAESELRIEPQSGELSPGSHCIVVFRLCCAEPVDVSGEVACMLEWTHLNAYGQLPEPKVDDAGQKVEYFAYHNQHIHEAMHAGKGLSAPHISVANRLTVSRFRTLMSTAAGQKFLNENLHRTAVLASHIPTMAQGNSQGGSQGAGDDMHRSNGHSDTMAGANRGQPPPEPPTSFPLYVRIRAVVGDWGISEEKRKEFLILGAAERLEDQEDAQDRDKRTGLDRQDDEEIRIKYEKILDSGSEEAVQKPAVVLEHILREIMAEGEFGQIMDSMLMQPTPVFSMFENSPPPGAAFVSPLKLPDGVGTLADSSSSGERDSRREESGKEGMLAQLLAAEPQPWSSRTLLNMPLPQPVQKSQAMAAAGSTQRSRGLTGKPPHAATFVQSLRQASRPPGSAGGSSGTGEPPQTHVEGGGDVPEGQWKDALEQYGEVDLDSFKVAAGDVMDKLLLDLMDDVVTGRLNWMRPLPRARYRR
jgi:hypothetical protein